MTIIYTEKGIGLHQAVAAAGHWLDQVDGVWTSSGDGAVQAIIDAYTLDQAKSGKCSMVSAHAKSLRDKVVSAISPGEMASWSIKASEAAKFGVASDASLCPMLSSEALARGVTVAALVARVNGNTQGFSTLEAQIGGTDGKHRDAIKVLTSFAGVAAYDFSAGWPTV